MARIFRFRLHSNRFWGALKSILFPALFPETDKQTKKEKKRRRLCCKSPCHKLKFSYHFMWIITVINDYGLALQQYERMNGKQSKFSRTKAVNSLYFCFEFLIYSRDELPFLVQSLRTTNCFLFEVEILKVSHKFACMPCKSGRHPSSVEKRERTYFPLAFFPSLLTRVIISFPNPSSVLWASKKADPVGHKEPRSKENSPVDYMFAVSIRVKFCWWYRAQNPYLILLEEFFVYLGRKYSCFSRQSERDERGTLYPLV